MKQNLHVIADTKYLIWLLVSMKSETRPSTMIMKYIQWNIGIKTTYGTKYLWYIFSLSERMHNWIPQYLRGIYLEQKSFHVLV